MRFVDPKRVRFPNVKLMFFGKPLCEHCVHWRDLYTPLLSTRQFSKTRFDLQCPLLLLLLGPALLLLVSKEFYSLCVSLMRAWTRAAQKLGQGRHWLTLMWWSKNGYLLPLLSHYIGSLALSALLLHTGLKNEERKNIWAQKNRLLKILCPSPRQGIPFENFLVPLWSFFKESWALI